MNRLIKAEFLKERKYNSLILLNGFTMVFVLLIYLWGAYSSNKNIRQEQLQIASKAGAYGLALFTAMFRKVWGVLYGFLIVNMEFVENRTDFFVPNTGRVKLFVSKFMVSSIVALVVVIVSYGLPFVISASISHQIQNDAGILSVIGQLLLVWFMTIGSIMLGMLIALEWRETIVVTAVLLTLEFFSNLYPKIIVDLWNRLDGYWYFSNLLQPTKNQLNGLTNYSFLVSDSFSDVKGLFIWIFIYLAMVVFGIYSVKRMEL